MNISANWNYRISFLVFFSLAVLFWSLSGNAWQGLKKQPPVTTFQNVGKLLAEDYDRMVKSEAQAKEPLPFSLWSQLDNQRLESPNTGRSQTVSWIAAKGDTRLILPVLETLHEEDIDGCLIDKATAEKLFADKNAVGGTVKLDGKEYTVRGVMDSPARTMVTQLATESKVPLDNVSVLGTQNTDTFLMRQNLSAAVTVKSDVYTSLAGILYKLPLLSILLAGLMLLGLVLAKWRQYPVRYMAVSIGMLALGTGTFLFLITMIPEKLIPSEWADFEFWNTAGRDWLQEVTDFLASAKYRPDLLRLRMVLQSALGMLSAYFIFRLYYLYRIHNGNKLLRMMLQNIQSGNLQISNGDRQIDPALGTAAGSTGMLSS